ncbi:MAG: hypothetical protein Q9O62_14690 [Ardenticatenia bacterium]|nr:hypothetical protein [Ardenticatenia bacterium]
MSLLDRSHRLARFGLMAVDVVLINVAFAVAYWMRYVQEWGGQVDPAYRVPYTQYVPVAAVLTALLLVTLTIEGVYNRRRGVSFFEELYAILNATTTSVVLMIAIFFFYRPYSYSRLIFAYVAALTVLFLGTARLIERLVRHQLRKRGSRRDAPAHRGRGGARAHAHAPHRGPSRVGLPNCGFCGR